jgi:hypothetical protein
MSETPVETNVDSTVLPVDADLETPNSTAAIIGGAIAGAVMVAGIGYIVKKARAIRKADEEKIHVITDLEDSESTEN